MALVTRDTGDFGKNAFGDDPTYGRQIMTWVTTHYDEAAAFGAAPSFLNGFGIKVWRQKRRDTTP